MVGGGDSELCDGRLLFIVKIDLDLEGIFFQIGDLVLRQTQNAISVLESCSHDDLLLAPE